MIASPVAKLDWPAFSLDLRLAMARANLSLRQLQTATGVDQATIHRVAKHGKPIAADSYIALAGWVRLHLPTTPMDTENSNG